MKQAWTRISFFLLFAGELWLSPTQGSGVTLDNSKNLDRDKMSPNNRNEKGLSAKGRYIVVLDADALKDGAQTASFAAESIASQLQGSVAATYSSIFTGFTVAGADPKTAESILENNPLVKDFTPDSVITVNYVQTENLPWGLDRIDATTGLDDSFTYPHNAGEGIDLYVIDTGIRVTHEEFAGRMAPDDEHANLVTVADTPPDPVWSDCYGHGTHVASTAAGTQYGVAKFATVHSLRVFNCAGEGLQSISMTAMEFAHDTCTAKNQKCVVNMSLVGAASSTYNSAVATLVDVGIHVVVAAGNDSGDACLKSPASADAAITVGATNSEDSLPWFSNFGACVNILAPGENTLAASYTCDNCTTHLSGTSMASPLVAGVVAVIFQDQVNQALPADPATVRGRLLDESAVGVIDKVQGSANLFLQMTINFDVPTLSPTDSSSPTETAPPSMLPSTIPSQLTCPENQVILRVTLLTDDFADQTSVNLTDLRASTNIFFWTHLEDATEYMFVECMLPSFFEVEVIDWLGDGLISPGYVEVIYDGELVKRVEGDFVHGQTFSFGEPTNSPTGSFSPTESVAPSNQPSVAPSLVPSTTPSTMPSQFACPEGQKGLRVTLLTDDFAGETSVTLTDLCTSANLISWTNLEDETEYTFRECVFPNVFEFEILDSVGDGLSFLGYVEVIYDGELIKRVTGDFDKDDTITFGATVCETEAPSQEPSASPTTCNGPLAVAWGDPHIITFSGLRFECHATGEMILAQTEGLRVHALFQRLSSVPLSLTAGIVLQQQGYSKVQVSLAEDVNATDATVVEGCPVRLFVDDTERLLATGSNLNDIEVNMLGSSAISIENIVTGLRSEIQIFRFGDNCLLTVYLWLPCEYQDDDSVQGVFGTPDGDTRDDWRDSTTGTVLQLPSDPNGLWVQPAYDYCAQQWCLGDSDHSIYRYDDTTSFEEKENCDAPYEPMSLDLVEASAKRTLEDICEGDLGCIWDGNVLGEAAAHAFVDSVDRFEELRGRQTPIDEEEEEEKRRFFLFRICSRNDARQPIV